MSEAVRQEKEQKQQKKKRKQEERNGIACWYCMGSGVSSNEICIVCHGDGIVDAA